MLYLADMRFEDNIKLITIINTCIRNLVVRAKHDKMIIAC